MGARSGSQLRTPVSSLTRVGERAGTTPGSLSPRLATSGVGHRTAAGRAPQVGHARVMTDSVGFNGASIGAGSSLGRAGSSLGSAAGVSRLDIGWRWSPHDDERDEGELPADESGDCEDFLTLLLSGDAEWDADVVPADADHEFEPKSSEDAHEAIARLLSDTARSSDPVGFRLMLALSSDGVSWTRTGLVIANHASVPCLAMEENESGVETLYLFFVTVREYIDPYLDEESFGSMKEEDGTPIRSTPLAVASTTNLTEWTYRLLDSDEAGFHYDTSVYDMEAHMYSALDPSVVRATGVTPDEAERELDPTLAPYQWMMYYTLHYDSGGSRYAAIHVAFAEHLYDFEWFSGNSGASVLPPSDADAGGSAADPTAAPLESDGVGYGYLLFAGAAGDVGEKGVNWAALLFDGVTTDYWAEVKEVCSGYDDGTSSSSDGGDPILLNNAIDAPGTSLDLTWIASAGDQLDRKIIAFKAWDFIRGAIDTASCSKIFEEDPDLSYEHNGIREAAVARFGGCWVMVYVTGIEPTSDPTPAP